jgi:hypothetical protein
MKKYIILIAAVLFFNVANAQRLDSKFIYDKLLDIYHKSLSIDGTEYFSQFGFGYGLYLFENLPDGSIIHPHKNFEGDKEFSFTTRSISGHLFATVESTYATRDRREFKDLMKYVESVGYKLTLSQYHDSVDSKVYQMDNFMVNFAHYNNDTSLPFKVIYSINAN